MAEMNLGKIILFVVVVVLLVLIGMYYMPVINTTYEGIDVTDFSTLTKGAFVFVPFSFIGFILYLAYKSAKR